MTSQVAGTATAGFPGSQGLARRILSTTDDSTGFVLRGVLAVVMFPHGAQHFLGWFGGYGFLGTYDWMTDALGIPGPLAATAILLEFLAPGLLMLGLGGRLAAASLGAILAVAATTHFEFGFMMNWFGQNQGEGWEFHALGVAIALALAIRGSGAWSIDRYLMDR